MTIEDFLNRLEAVRKSGNGWIAFCPAHDDTQRSLSITERDGKILLKCFAGCSAEAIVESLRLKLKDLFSEGGGVCVFSLGNGLHTCTDGNEHTENTTKKVRSPKMAICTTAR